MELTDIPRWTEFACERCGCPELAETIEHSFNKRLRRAVGRAKPEIVDNVVQGGKIELASFHWPRLTEEGRRNVVIHEACHIIHSWLYWPVNRESHGLAWKRLMLRCGARPHEFLQTCEVREECRQTQVHLPTGLVVARCRCTGRKKISSRQASLLRTGGRLSCDVCRGPIRLIY